MKVPFEIDSGPFFGHRESKSGKSSNPRDSTWPSRTIILPRTNSVTFCFSARSHPNKDKDGSDRLRWGLRCHVRGLVLLTIPWLLDLQSTLAAVASRMAASLVQGPLPSASEQRLHGWLKDQSRYHLLSGGLISPTAAEAPVSAESVFLDAFITGSAVHAATFPQLELLCQLTNQVQRGYAARAVLHAQPSHVQQSWSRACRTVVAAMAKHSGLTPSLLALSAPTGSDPPPEDAQEVVRDRFRFIVSQTFVIQDWMLKQVQRIREWDQWLARVPSSDETKTRESKEQTPAAPVAAEVRHLMGSVRIPVTCAEFRQSYGDQADTLRDWCALKDVPFAGTSLPELEVTVKRLYQVLEKEYVARPVTLSPENENEQLSAYVFITDRVLRLGFAILQFHSVASPPLSSAISGSSPSSLSLHRALTSHPTAKHGPSLVKRRSAVKDDQETVPNSSGVERADTFGDRVQELRSWIDTVQQWRHASQASSTQGCSHAQVRTCVVPHSNPIESISSLIQQGFDAQCLLDTAHSHNVRARLRASGLHRLTQLLKSVSFDVARMNLLGAVYSSLQQLAREVNRPRSVASNVASSPAMPRGHQDTPHIMAESKHAANVSSGRSTDEFSVHVLFGLECCHPDSCRAVSVEYSAFASELLGYFPPVEIAAGDIKPSVSSSSSTSVKPSLGVRLLALHDLFGFECCLGDEEEQAWCIHLLQRLVAAASLKSGVEELRRKELTEESAAELRDSTPVVTAPVPSPPHSSREDSSATKRARWRQDGNLRLNFSGAAGPGAKSHIPVLAVVVERANASWSALRSLAMQCLNWDAAKLKACLPLPESPDALRVKCQQLQHLHTLIFQALASELESNVLLVRLMLERHRKFCYSVRLDSACAAEATPYLSPGRPIAPPLALCERPAASLAGVTARDVMDGIDKILSFLFVILPVSPSTRDGLSHEVQCSLVRTTFSIIHHASESFLSPRGVHLAIRLARRVILLHFILCTRFKNCLLIDVFLLSSSGR